MDPLTILLPILKITGLDEKIGGALKGLIGDKTAAKALSAVNDIFGTVDSNEISKKSTANPELIQALEKQINELALKELELLLADTANARDLQGKALAQDDLFSKRFVYYFAGAWSLFAAIFIISITFGDIPQQNVRFADTILGFVLATLVGTIIQYFYGSSQASKNKDSTLSKLATAIKGE